MQHNPPAAPAVRETLKRLLVSETFSRSERARDLLQYLVDRELAGEADRLKGFSIAVDVFGKDSDFDPSTDAVVRVQAGRLRDLLQQYFATEGKSEPIHITIPRGSYIPIYELSGEKQPPAAKDAVQPTVENSSSPSANALAPASSISRQLASLWLTVAAVVAVLGFLLLREGGLLTTTADANVTNIDTPAITSSIDASQIDTLPKIYIASAGGLAQVKAVEASLRRGLSGFDTVDFIARPIDPAVEKDQKLTFLFRLFPGPSAGTVTIELQNIGSGRLLLSRTLTPVELMPSELDDEIAGLLTATMTASGIVYTYIEQAGLQVGLLNCLLLNDDYYQDPNASTHEKAYRCFEQLQALNAKSALVYSEMSALHLEAVTDGYAYPPEAKRDTAIAMAHRAVQMAATSPYAHRAYGYMQSRLGNSDESIRWTRKAYELNTYDLTMAAAYGYGLIFAGRYEEGTPIMARAVEETSARPPWWDYGLFLGQLMLGNTSETIRATASLHPTAQRSHYIAARIIAADLNRDTVTKKRLIKELERDFPRFAANPRKTFTQRKYPKDLTDRLVEGLRIAGLGSSS